MQNVSNTSFAVITVEILYRLCVDIGIDRADNFHLFNQLPKVFKPWSYRVLFHLQGVSEEFLGLGKGNFMTIS